jgi:hypothetical protein
MQGEPMSKFASNVEAIVTRLSAAYIAKSGKRYEDDTHSGCLFAALDAGEPEVKGFPDGDLQNLDDIETRMGFILNGEFLTRKETDLRFGFQLAEEQDS